MALLPEFGVCDCHSHVFGPFAQFALSEGRTFDPPESPVETLEGLWRSLGITRAVLVQGSAHGEDPAAMLAAIARAPEERRGVALVRNDVSDAMLATLHEGGVRAVRFNWIRHLLVRDSRTEEDRMDEAAALLERLAPLGWHVEVHIDAADVHLIESLETPPRMPVVVDHMARVDLAAADSRAQLNRLLGLMAKDKFWVKVSGADRLTAKVDDLRAAVAAMRDVIAAAPDRCVWGLDWPHVNLARKRGDLELMQLLSDVARDDATLRRLLIENPERLYGFPAAKNATPGRAGR